MPYKPNPTISAYAGLHGGSHDFRSHPIAPAGIKIIIHDKPAARASWAAHGARFLYRTRHTALSLFSGSRHCHFYNAHHGHGPMVSTRFPHAKNHTHDNALAAIADSSSDWKGKGVTIIVSTVDTVIALSIFSCKDSQISRLLIIYE
jgi:hypothetical protein